MYTVAIICCFSSSHFALLPTEGEQTSVRGLSWVTKEKTHLQEGRSLLLPCPQPRLLGRAPSSGCLCARAPEAGSAPPSKPRDSKSRHEGNNCQ